MYFNHLQDRQNWVQRVQVWRKGRPLQTTLVTWMYSIWISLSTVFSSPFTLYLSTCVHQTCPDLAIGDNFWDLLSQAFPLSLGAESVSGRTKNREDRVGNFVRSVIRLLNKNVPRLFEIMKQTLVPPGSTTGIERIFSVAGCILSERRTKTSGENF